MEEKLDKIQADVSEIKAVQRVQAQILDDHMRRTELAEEGLAKADARLRPLETHAAVFGAIGKAVAVLGTLVGIVLGLLKAFGG